MFSRNVTLKPGYEVEFPWKAFYLPDNFIPALEDYGEVEEIEDEDVGERRLAEYRITLHGIGINQERITYKYNSRSAFQGGNKPIGSASVEFTDLNPRIESLLEREFEKFKQSL